MACPDMTTNVCVVPRILSAEITMPARLSATLRNYWRAIVNLRLWQIGKDREIEHAVVTEECVVRDAKRVNDSPSGSSGESTSPAYAEFIRTQSQLMEDMLKTIILAAGGEIDNGSANRDRSKIRR